MQAILLMVASTWLFATMGVAVKAASAVYGTGEIVFYRGLIGALMMAAWSHRLGLPLRTRLPAMHFWRSVSGVSALVLWFYAIGKLPLATAVTLNYMSSVWMALFLLGGAVLLGAGRVDGRLIATVLTGFAGVVLVLRPTLDRDQLWAGVTGLLSGMLSATAYLQVTALGRAGEPEPRVVFYFSLCGLAVGALLTTGTGSWHGHSVRGLLLLLAIGGLATLAQLLMTRAYAIGRPLTNASLQYLGIVYSFGYGVWLFDDAVSASALGGMALIMLAGLAASLLRRHHAPSADGPPTES
jgi:drug/metabolite transporter (DMT)-like permease